MSETYKPIIQSGAYTIEWAKRRGVTPEQLNPLELISDDLGRKQKSRHIVSQLIGENLEICGPDGRVSLPTYPVKRLLPANEAAYYKVVDALHSRYLEAVKQQFGTNEPLSLVRLFSVGFGPDGYIPSRSEGDAHIHRWIRPQVVAAKERGYRPIVEATTTRRRLENAWRVANDVGVGAIDIGLALGSHGHLAADGTTVAEILALLDANEDCLETKVVLGANCGSLTGIEKAAVAHPGTFQFAYANTVDVEDIDHLAGVGNGTIHHHKDPVTVDEFARVARNHRFPVVSLCCGFCPEDLQKLKAAFETSIEAAPTV